jgi:hypothetical protein
MKRFLLVIFISDRLTEPAQKFKVPVQEAAWTKVKVHGNAHVAYEKNRLYSVLFSVSAKLSGSRPPTPNDEEPCFVGGRLTFCGPIKYGVGRNNDRAFSLT